MNDYQLGYGNGGSLESGSLVEMLLGYAGQVADLKNKFDPDTHGPLPPKFKPAPVPGEWWKSPLVIGGAVLAAVLGLFLLLRK